MAAPGLLFVFMPKLTASLVPRPRKGGRPQRGKKFKTLSGEFLGENPFFASTAIMGKGYSQPIIRSHGFFAVAANIIENHQKYISSHARLPKENYFCMLDFNPKWDMMPVFPGGQG